jgi:hypothetical protein
MPRLIIANYSGFALAALVALWPLKRYLRVTVENGWKQALVAGAIVFLVAWAVKLPFVARCLRKRSWWFARSIRASLALHAVSCAIVFVWYVIPSEFALYTDIAHDVAVPSLPYGEASCYYISPHDDTVYRISLSGGQPVTIATLDTCHSMCRLEALFEENPPRIALYAEVGTQAEEARTVSLDSKVCGDDLLLFPRDYSGTKGENRIVDLRQPYERHLEFAIGPSNNPGLEITRLVSGLDSRKQYSLKRERIRLGLQTPFFQCRVSYVTVLPNDYVVFQIENEICVFDPSSRSLTRIAAGRCPVVFLQR